MEIVFACLLGVVFWFAVGYLVLEMWKMTVACLDDELKFYHRLKPTAKVVVRVIVFCLWPLALLFILLLFLISTLPEMTISIKQMFTED